MKRHPVSTTNVRKRPANPFKDYQNNVVEERVKIVVRYLTSLRKTRAKFEYITDLAKAVAEQVGLTEGKPCSFTTLLRNARYKALLLNFMAMRLGNEAIKVSEPGVQAFIQTLELELGNVKRDNTRLRAYVAELEARIDSRPGPLPNPIQTKDRDALNELSNDKALACKAMWLLLDHFKGLVSVDTDRNCIIDLAAASERKNIVVEAEIAYVFIDWLKANACIG